MDPNAGLSDKAKKSRPYPEADPRVFFRDAHVRGCLLTSLYIIASSRLSPASEQDGHNGLDRRFIVEYFK